MKPSDPLTILLNDLIRINKDRIESYEKAYIEYPEEEPGVKNMFRQMADTSRRFCQELNDAGRTYLLDPAACVTTSGRLYRLWLDLRTALCVDGEKTVLVRCEYGEDVNERAYDKALESEEELPPAILNILITQRNMLKKAHEAIRYERNIHRQN